MAVKRQKIERITVEVRRKSAKKEAAYSYMSKSTAEFFGWKAVKSNVRAAKGKGGKVRVRAFRGSVGAGSIQVPLEANASRGTQKKISYRSIPMPGDVTIAEIQTFLKSGKRKPTHFITRDGRRYPVPA